MGMIRFSWRSTAVKAQIMALPARERWRAQVAHRFLLRSSASAYKDFVRDHDHFLQRHINPDERQRKRRYEYIETVGLECALWPSLFWDVTLSYTFERSTDIRRDVGDRRKRRFRKVASAQSVVSVGGIEPARGRCCVCACVTQTKLAFFESKSDYRLIWFC